MVDLKEMSSAFSVPTVFTFTVTFAFSPLTPLVLSIVTVRRDVLVCATGLPSE